MRPSFKVTLLLLSLLFSVQVQGIRLEKKHYMSGEQHKSIHVEENTLTKTNNINGVPKEAGVCKLKGDCISGNNRKLMISVTPSTTTTTTTSKNEKNGKNKADPISNGEKGANRSQQYGVGEEKSSISSSTTVNSLSTSKRHPDYPDVIDLAEMDYAPARRKTPIHN